MTVTSSLSVRRTQRLIGQQIELTLTNMADQIGTLSVVPSPPTWRTYRQYLEWLVQRDVQGEGFKIEPVFIAIRDENDQVRAFAMRADVPLVDERTGRPYATWNPTVQRALVQQAEKGELAKYGILHRYVRYGEPPRRTVDVGFRQQVAYEALHRIATINAAVTLGFVILGIVLSVALSGELVRPIERLTGAMQRVGLGDLDQRVDLRTGDELGVMGARFNQMLIGLRERAFLRAALTRYVSVQVAEKMLAEGTWLFEPEEREVTVMFCDIRGFTPLSERLTPGEVFHLLNEYFGIMVDVIFAHRGTLDKFMGDCIMAVWGSPQLSPEHALLAVRASLDMRQALEQLNSRRRARGQAEIHMGIGLNTGICFAGSLGATGGGVRRLEYAVIGDDINVAQRIESKTGPMQILISESTYRGVADRVVVERQEPIAAKGKSQPVPVYLLKGLREGPALAALGVSQPPPGREGA
jgi:class 3 adenylate cyclase